MVFSYKHPAAHQKGCMTRPHICWNRNYLHINSEKPKRLTALTNCYFVHKNIKIKRLSSKRFQCFSDIFVVRCVFSYAASRSLRDPIFISRRIELMVVLPMNNRKTRHHDWEKRASAVFLLSSQRGQCTRDTRGLHFPRLSLFLASSWGTPAFALLWWLFFR